MKQLNFFLKLIFLLFISITLKGQCPSEENLYFSNQSQINQFIIDYPDCEHLNATLVVHASTPINNLEGFRNLKSVSGMVSIFMGNSSNQNIEGLRNLEYLGDHFIIIGNTIRSIDNIFNKLKTINGMIRIENNQYLERINDFNSIINCNNIFIYDNLRLESINGFNSIVDLPGRIEIMHTQLNVDQLLIEGFNSLEKVNHLIINHQLNNLNINAFNNLQEINGNLELRYMNPSINSFPILNKINGSTIITIWGLEDLLPLTTLNYLGSSFILASSEIETLWGLENISQFNGLSFVENPSLSFCSLPNICNYLNQGGFGQFENNAPGCNSVQEVLDNCNMSIDSHELNSKIEMYPNPVKNDLNISVKDNSLKINKISLYDLSGKLVNEFKNQSKLNLSFYPNGNYVIVIHTDKGFISKKITITK